MPTFQRDGQPIHYEDTGGNGPAVIFAHAFAMTAAMFAPQIAAFREHRCIAFDERAHGASPASKPFTFWDSAADLLALLDHLGIEKATLVGTSQGGFIALRAALLAPARAAGVAVFGSSAAAEASETKVAYGELRDGFVGGANGPPEGVLDTIARICFGPSPRFEAETWKAIWRRWPAAQFDYAFRCLVDRDGIEERLSEIAAPVLVLHGSEDAAYTVERGRAIASGVRQGAFQVVEGGAHFLSITDPEPVNEALRSFFETTRGR